MIDLRLHNFPNNRNVSLFALKFNHNFYNLTKYKIESFVDPILVELTELSRKCFSGFVVECEFRIYACVLTQNKWDDEDNDDGF